ncbi:MAG: hypothetical protein GY832_07835 [Chloroflexi bacterium]|nr:hypothetical protein [Chloroflexota bacterium]
MDFFKVGTTQPRFLYLASAATSGKPRTIEMIPTSNIMGSEKLIKCVGCGALVPDIDGPTHAYIGALPGCWAIFGEILAKEYGEYGYPKVHRLTVDAYAVQHPGTPSRKSIQSVVVHLLGLYFVLERGYESQKATWVLQRATSHRENFVWLQPPTSMGTMTVIDVNRAKDLAEHEQLVKEWARASWEAWSQHHEQVEKWASL